VDPGAVPFVPLAPGLVLLVAGLEGSAGFAGVELLAGLSSGLVALVLGSVLLSGPVLF